GPPEKIARALTVAGLAHFFKDNIFSSYDVGSWKPDPGLFLHAADKMAFPPERCVVVEDSDVGIEAALAAGMRALRYGPSNDDSVTGAATFNDMAQLPYLLGKLQRITE